jgi:hypothetical protein
MRIRERGLILIAKTIVSLATLVLCIFSSEVVGQEPLAGAAGMAMWPPPAQSPHRVIQQPQWLAPKQAKKRHMHELVHPPVATIQAAVIEPGWRQPYAYGFFGAKPTRHPVRHFGYRQDYTQWTWK